METYLIVAIGAAAAGFVQGLSGFAFGLVAMAIWAWVLDPVVVGPLIVFGSLVGQTVPLISMGRTLRPLLALPMLIGGCLGVPVGVFLLHVIDPLAFKISVGVLLMSWCPFMLFAHDLPHVRQGRWWADLGVGGIGGVMGGLGGLTGPAPILWATLRRWDRHTQRSILQVYFFGMQLLTMVLYLASGAVPRDILPLFAAMAPAMLLPTLLGYRLYHRVSERLFRRVILGLLTASGASLIVTSALH